jgi:hypothetical protein
MVVTMGKHDERGWTKQDAEDAGRLLAGMVRRAKKAVEAESSTQIEDPGASPPGERAAEWSATGVEAHHLRQQLTVALWRDSDGSGEPVNTYRVGGKTLVADNDHYASSLTITHPRR